MKRVLKQVLKVICVGFAIGLLVSLFSFLAHTIIDFSRELFAYQRNVWIIALGFILAIIFAYLSTFFVQYNSFLEFSGVPQLETIVKRKKGLKHHSLLTVPLLMINSLISFVCGVSLGNEGSTVSLAGNIAITFNQIDKEEDNELVAVGSGVGFGLASHSPLAGFFYTFEESLHRFKWQLIWKIILMMGVAYGVMCLFNTENVIPFNVVEIIPLTKVYLYLGLIPLCLLAGVLFHHCIVWLSEFFKHHEHWFIVRHRFYLVFIISMATLIFVPFVAGTGHHVLSEVFNYTSIGMIAIFFLIKFFLTVFAGSSKVTGGVVIPLFALGGMLGYGYGLIFVKIGLISVQEIPLIMVIAMLSMFVVVNQSPLTAITYALSMVGFKMSIKFEVFIPIVVIILACFYISKLFIKEDLYDSLAEQIE